LNVAGTLDASAPSIPQSAISNPQSSGGYIETSGAHVVVDPNAVITTAAPSGKTGVWLIDPVDFTIAATGGDMTGTALSSALGLNNVLIQSISGAAGTMGDVNVNDVVSWSANKLTLNAQRNININATMNGSGTASLALEYGQGALATGNLSDYIVHAAVNLPAGQNFSTKLGNNGVVTNYTVITNLGVANSITTTDLQGMNGNLAGHYALGTNINAAATSGWNIGAGFMPVGSLFGFTGAFDGLGHTISNLIINGPITNNVGIFGWMLGNVRNVGLLGGSVTGSNNVGGLVGFNAGSISDSYTTGTVIGSTGSNGGIGGLVGYNSGIVSNSYATGSITGNGIVGSGIGGLVGFGNLGAIINSYATGTVSGTGNGSNVGGLIGLDTSGTVSNSYASGGVTNNGSINVWVGGLAGGIVGSTISNCYARGSVTSIGNSNQIGGLLGQIASGTVSNSYATGLVASTGLLNLVGGLVGGNGGGLSLGLGGTIRSGYWDIATSAQTISAGGLGLTTAQMKQQASFVGWDFANNWSINQGVAYPILAWQPGSNQLVQLATAQAAAQAAAIQAAAAQAAAAQAAAQAAATQAAAAQAAAQAVAAQAAAAASNNAAAQAAAQTAANLAAATQAAATQATAKAAAAQVLSDAKAVAAAKSKAKVEAAQAITVQISAQVQAQIAQAKQAMSTNHSGFDLNNFIFTSDMIPNNSGVAKSGVGTTDNPGGNLGSAIGSATSTSPTIQPSTTTSITATQPLNNSDTMNATGIVVTSELQLPVQHQVFKLNKVTKKNEQQFNDDGTPKMEWGSISKSTHLKKDELIDSFAISLGGKSISIDAISNGFEQVQQVKRNKETKKNEPQFNEDGSPKMVSSYDNLGDNQCTSLIGKYLTELGAKKVSGNGVAVSANLADKSFDINGNNFNFKSFTSPSATLPKAGAVISGNAFTKAGHVAIVKGVALSEDGNSAKIILIEQNGGSGSYGDKINREITLYKGADGGWSGMMYEGKAITGWANIEPVTN
jgi:hypothetical protein